ncbi:hypothetical protein [Flavobacterium sp.]
MKKPHLTVRFLILTIANYSSFITVKTTVTLNGVSIYLTNA